MDDKQERDTPTADSAEKFLKGQNPALKPEEDQRKRELAEGRRLYAIGSDIERLSKELKLEPDPDNETLVYYHEDREGNRLSSIYVAVEGEQLFNPFWLIMAGVDLLEGKKLRIEDRDVFEIELSRTQYAERAEGNYYYMTMIL